MMHGIPLMMPRLSVKFNEVCFGTFLSTLVLFFFFFFFLGGGGVSLYIIKSDIYKIWNS